MSKINDLSNSSLRKRFFEKDSGIVNNYAVAVKRVSTKRQQRGQSLNEQTEIISNYTYKEKLNVVNNFEYAESASKKEDIGWALEVYDFILQSHQTSRPVMNVIFSHQSRSSRNKALARLWEQLFEKGVQFHFAREGRKITSEADMADWMMWHMENLRNEAFINELTKNSMGGTIRLIERGLYPGRPPFGFRSAGKKEDRHFFHDGEKANYMKLAFEYISTGQYTDKKLKQTLDDMFPLLDRTPILKKFNELFRNPFYYGDFYYAGEHHKGNSDLHPPLVTKELWDQVQNVLDKRHKPRRLSKFHPYQGLMKCNGKIIDNDGNLTDQKCGCAVTAEKIRKSYKSGRAQEFNYYRCSNTTKNCSQRDKVYMKDVVGRNISYRQEEIEVIFEDIFKSFSFDELTCQKMKKYLLDEHCEKKELTKEKISELRDRYGELSVMINRAYEDKCSRKISEVDWEAVDSKWQSERAEIEAEMRMIDDDREEYMHRGVELIELMQHTEMIYKNATSEKKRKLVELVSSNLLLSDGTIEYEYKKPFDLLCKTKGNIEMVLPRGFEPLLPP